MEIHVQQLIEAYGRIGHISAYHIYLGLLILDLVTGNIKGILTKQYSSSIGTRGLIKNLTLTLVVLLICPYLWLIGLSEVGLAILGILSFIYLISILENLEQMGLDKHVKAIRPIFESLRPYFEQMENKEVEDEE